MQLWRKISEQKFKGRDSQSTGKGEIGIAGLMKETEEKYFLKFKKMKWAHDKNYTTKGTVRSKQDRTILKINDRKKR